MTFDRDTKKQLNHYVYLLIDPRFGKIFYVGKASANNRAFDHFRANDAEDKKQKLIAEIREAGYAPEVHILRHGLEKATIAEEVEAAVIDAIGLENLTNLCRGKGIGRGRATVSELKRRYGSQPIKQSSLREPFMKIWINDTYSPTLDPQQLYDATRQFWHQVGVAVRTPDEDGNLRYPTVLALVENVVVMVYRVKVWLPAGATMSSRPWHGTEEEKRWEFIGHPLPDHRLMGKLLCDDQGEGIKGNERGFGYIN